MSGKQAVSPAASGGRIQMHRNKVTARNEVRISRSLLKHEIAQAGIPRMSAELGVKVAIFRAFAANERQAAALPRSEMKSRRLIESVAPNQGQHSQFAGSSQGSLAISAIVAGTAAMSNDARTAASSATREPLRPSSVSQ
jgi:hypothetical protein